MEHLLPFCLLLVISLILPVTSPPSSPEGHLFTKNERKEVATTRAPPSARSLLVLPPMSLMWVAAGDKIPHKDGPGITRSDLPVITKVDRAPMVGASRDIMNRDTKKMREDRLYVFANMKDGQGVDVIMEFIVREGMLEQHKKLANVLYFPRLRLG